MPIITATIRDIAGGSDNTAWNFSSVLRESASGSAIISTKTVTVKPVNGVLSVNLDPGYAVASTLSGARYAFVVPETNANLWDLIEAGVALPPTTSGEQLASAIAAYLAAHPPTAEAEWATISGKPDVIAAGADQAAARSAIGAGTSSLALGTTAGTAKAGDYQPSWSDVTSKPAFGSSAVTDVSAYATAAQGALADTAVQGNDARLTDERTPVDGSVGLAKFSATGTPSGTVFLRGDNTWATPPGGGGGISNVVDDPTPQLGGDLDLNGHAVGAATAADLTKLHDAGTLSGNNTGDQDLSGYATTAGVAAGYQPLDAELTALAAMTDPAGKLGGIAAGAEVNVNADWNAGSGDAQILNKPAIQGPITLTTTGTSGAATFVGDTLNIPQYTGGGGGSGDVTGPAASVDSEVALYSGTGGKTLKRATGSGLAKLTAGVLGTAAAGTDYLAPNGSAAALTGFPTLNQSTTGNAATATKLVTSRTLRTDLASTSASGFDGSANVTPGVTGTLPVASGGTGATTAAAARAALAGFASIATAAGTTVAVVTDPAVVVYTGTTTHTHRLPTTSVAAGDRRLVINDSTGIVTVQSSGANAIVALPPGTHAWLTARQATPTTAAHWHFSRPIWAGTAAAYAALGSYDPGVVYVSDGKRVATVTQSATPSINVDTSDVSVISGLAQAITGVTVTGTGKPEQQHTIKLKDNGTGRAITWGTSFTGTLLATTVAGKWHRQLVVWDADVSKFVGMAADTAGY